MMPILSVTSAGFIHVIMAMGAIRKCPSWTGNASSRSRMMTSMRFTMSVGNRMESAVPVRRPSRIRSTSIPRLRPSRPPAPAKKKP